MANPHPRLSDSRGPHITSVEKKGQEAETMIGKEGRKH